jgi:hypothetical protein
MPVVIDLSNGRLLTGSLPRCLHSLRAAWTV